MKIGILASQAKRKAWENKETPSSTFSWVQDNEGHEHYDVFVDLDFDDNSYRMQDYFTNSQTVFVLGAVKCSLDSAAVGLEMPKNWKGIGINALPTLIERSTLECTNPFQLPEASLEELASLLGYQQIEVVGSRVGLITPRVICMINDGGIVRHFRSPLTCIFQMRIHHHYAHNRLGIQITIQLLALLFQLQSRL